MTAEHPNATPNTTDRPLRILMLAQFYPPIIGGIETHVQALSHSLAARGHEVMVATLATDGVEPGERCDGPVRVSALQGAVQRIGPLFSSARRHAIPLPDPELVAGLRRVIAEFQPDIVHAHNWLGRSFLPLKKATGVPYVVSLHDSSRICTQARWMYKDAELCTGPSVSRCLSCCATHFGTAKGTVTYLGNRLARGSEARAVDMFLPVSRAVAESNRLAADNLPFEVMPNFAVPSDTVADSHDPRLARLPDEPYIMQAGDIVPDKGADVLIEAYRDLPSPPPLVLIGRIAEQTRATLPPGAIAMGEWPHELVLEAWRRSLFGTAPSIFLDPCPTTAYEAMAAGKAVIASARGGLLDQVADEVTGIFVTPGDASDLRNAMQRLLDDPDLRDRMGAAGRQRFEELFEVEVIVDRIEGVYRGLAAT
jgi:glycosyltransferase involved in cell wall biosynthesis